MSCPANAAWAAWVLGEAGDAGETDEGLEAHLFQCASCAARAERLHQLAATLRELLPPWLTPERRQQLVERLGEALQVVPVRAGETAALTLGPGREVGLWVLQADLRGAERLHCEMVSLEGAPLFTWDHVPFDAERGELVLACQLHYQVFGLPDEVRLRVNLGEASGDPPLAEYRLRHFFENV